MAPNFGPSSRSLESRFGVQNPRRWAFITSLADFHTERSPVVGETFRNFSLYWFHRGISTSSLGDVATSHGMWHTSCQEGRAEAIGSWPARPMIVVGNFRLGDQFDRLSPVAYGMICTRMVSCRRMRKCCLRWIWRCGGFTRFLAAQTGVLADMSGFLSRASGPWDWKSVAVDCAAALPVSPHR